MRGEPGDQRLRLLIGALPERVVLQPDEDKAGVLAAPSEAEAVHGERGVDDAFLVVEQVVGNILQRTRRDFLGRTCRRPNQHEHRSLIFVRQERLRQLHEQKSVRADHREVDDEPSSGAPDHVADA